MAEERWGHPRWAWRALAVSAALAVLLLLTSLTVSGRAFAVMLLIAEAFIGVYWYVGWAREEVRFDAELRSLGDSEPPL